MLYDIIDFSGDVYLNFGNIFKEHFLMEFKRDGDVS